MVWEETMKYPDLRDAVSGACLTAIFLAVPCLAQQAAAQNARPQQLSEAPALAEAVKAGTLPPVEERVSDEPEVIQPIEGVGTYGGELRFGLRGSSDHNHILRMVGPQGLVRWNPDYTEIVPNVAESCEVSEDGQEFTFHLRDGMKWSDGEPFTADDMLFNMKDLVLNADSRRPRRATWRAASRSRSRRSTTTTVKFTFAEPYGDFLAELAIPLGQHPVLYPKHYCSQFHPDLQHIDRRRRCAKATAPATGRTSSCRSAATSKSRRAGAIRTGRRSIPGSSRSPIRAARRASS